MSQFDITEHEIYKKRGKTNMGIALILAAIVVLIVLGTISKLSATGEEAAREYDALQAQDEAQS